VPELDQLVSQLARLDDAAFVTVLEHARRERTARRAPPPERPRAFDRDAFARWYAVRHLSTEPALREVVYLPAGAPANEIRLVEVNALATDAGPVEPLDFGADADLPGAHRVLVADVSPEQWDRLARGELALPPGWALAGARAFDRKG
jgi:hypothetical protein